MTRPLANWRGLSKLRSAIISPPCCRSKLREPGRLKWNFYERLSTKHNISLKIVFWGEELTKVFLCGSLALFVLHFLDLCIRSEYFSDNYFLVPGHWTFLPCPHSVRPSANVTNCRPIAPPYNNFAFVLFTIFCLLIGTRQSLKTLTWAQSADTLFVIHKILLFSQNSDLD